MTWIVSTFVLLHLVQFVTTRIVPRTHVTNRVGMGGWLPSEVPPNLRVGGGHPRVELRESGRDGINFQEELE